MSKWNTDTIAAEILRRHASGLDLSYSGMTREDLPLLRAAARYLGSWEAAVRHAGLDYDSLRRYRAWTNDRIVARILELNEQGADLSWRHVSLTLDPGLAAAATKKSHFGSWRAALEAAGLDYDAIRRYRDWSDDEILRLVRDKYAQGMPLNAKTMERDDISLITAARRRFPSWDRALVAAGLDYREIVLRAPFRRKRTAIGTGEGESETSTRKPARSGRRHRIPASESNNGQANGLTNEPE